MGVPVPASRKRPRREGLGDTGRDRCGQRGEVDGSGARQSLTGGRLESGGLSAAIVSMAWVGAGLTISVDMGNRSRLREVSDTRKCPLNWEKKN